MRLTATACVELLASQPRTTTTHMHGCDAAIKAEVRCIVIACKHFASVICVDVRGNNRRINSYSVELVEHVIATYIFAIYVVVV